MYPALRLLVIVVFVIGLIQKMLIKQDLLIQQQGEILNLLKQVLLSTSSAAAADKNNEYTDLLLSPMDEPDQMSEFCQKIDDDSGMRKKVVSI
jgi:hypothetical protein